MFPLFCCLSLQSGKPRSFDELEAELLKGQKLQGVLTSNEVQVRTGSTLTLPHNCTPMCAPALHATVLIQAHNNAPELHVSLPGLEMHHMPSLHA